MKAVAMYLPQFHRIPENDKWWGEGFTEWTTVQKAEPLFEGHDQPKVPWNNNYYNLMEYPVMAWQAALARQYGIDGFCFYHYFFKNGRKILEKPAEQLLKHHEIDINFCFCWANETWARTWSNVGDKNSWGEKFESAAGSEEGRSGILLEQDYGQEELWTEHFYSLLPYFKDKRYININGRPVFLLYKPEKIYCLHRMIEVWEKLADKENISKIYLIGVNVNHKIKGLEAVLLQGPSACREVELCYCRLESKKSGNVLTQQYADLCKAALEAEAVSGTKTYFGAFTGFDDTPRRAENGLCLIGSTPHLFQQFFYEMLKKNLKCGNEFVFVNAWNEWGEGMYLEPDQKYGFQYLEAVQSAFDRMKNDRKAHGSEAEDQDRYGQGACSIDTARELGKRLFKFRQYYNILDQWFRMREQGRSAVQYFIANHYRNAAVYGWGDLGRHLCRELKAHKFEVKYIIDRNKYAGREVLSLEEFEQRQDDVAVVIVTAVSEFDLIYSELKKKVKCPVISLEEIIFAKY